MYKGKTPVQPTASSRMHSPSNPQARSFSSSKPSRTASQHTSPAPSPSPPSASARDPGRPARSSCTTTCSVSGAATARNSSESSPRRAESRTRALLVTSPPCGTGRFPMSRTSRMRWISRNGRRSSNSRPPLSPSTSSATTLPGAADSSKFACQQSVQRGAVSIICMYQCRCFVLHYNARKHANAGEEVPKCKP
jgi:hypothetical protein